MRRLMPLEEPTSQDALNQVANGLNDYLAGLNWAEIETVTASSPPWKNGSGKIP